MKKYLLFAAAAILATGCTEKKGYEITGTVSNTDLNGNYVYLYDFGGTDAAPVDSALVENGTFVLSGDQEDPIWVTLKFADHVVKQGRAMAAQNPPYTASFILENGKINVLLNDISSVSGTSKNEGLTAFQAALREHQEELNEISASANTSDPAAREEAMKRYNEASERYKTTIKNYIAGNKDNVAGGKFLYDFRHNLNEQERRELIENADETFVAAPGVDQVMQHLETLSKVAVGKKFTDVELADPKGEMHKLSEYAGNGKVVLIDFWAAWCPPCRAQMPFLVELYRKYKGQDFEIVGISLDRTTEEWEKGIKDLNITWPQMGDLKYWQSEGAALYGVNSIPHLVLVGKDGTIVAKNIHGEELENTIKAEMAK